MRFQIHRLQQEALIELGLNVEDALLLDWLLNWKDGNSMERIVVGDDVAYWVNYSKVIEELPILFKKTNGFESEEEAEKAKRANTTKVARMLKGNLSKVLTRHEKKVQGKTKVYISFNREVVDFLVNNNNKKASTDGESVKATNQNKNNIDTNSISQNSKKYSWKNIFVFAGSFTGFVCLVWLSAWCAGGWAKKSVDTKAAALGITPSRVAANEPAELKSLVDREFYSKHPKYNPPRSGKYDWKKDTIPADEKAYTMKIFTSPELETYLTDLKKSAAYIAKTDVQYLSPLQHFRSLVRHRADIAELYFRTNQKEKVLPELLKYPELDRLIPADTPHLICELVRTAGRWIWIEALIQYGPEDKTHLSTYRELLDWSKSWQVHLPHEAGFYLALPVEVKGKVAAFFYTPYLNTTKYRGFSEAVNRIPALKKLEQQEFISENGMYAKAAKRQRLGIVLSQTALALKLFKIEKGEYPQKLSELVPCYLPKEYVSPYTGKKLNYILKDGFFTLASDDRTITSKR
jgi:hypothetical protein